MWQKARLTILIIIAVLMTVLVMLNWQPIEINVFHFWRLKASLSLFLLFAFVLGFGFGWFGHLFLLYKQKKSTAQTLVSSPKGTIPDFEDS